MPKSKYYLLSLSLSLSLSSLSQGENKIRINQEGYFTSAPKQAVIINEDIDSLFFILSVEGGDTVFRGKLLPAERSLYSDDKLRIADFNSLRKEGRYQLVLPSGNRSYSFRIGPKVLNKVAYSTIKAFYYQRVSIPLLPEHAGKWARPAGHPDKEVIIHPSARHGGDTIISSPHGWYDAGDYNKYIVNSGITMATLLSAYEDYPSKFVTLNLNIPESGNKIPDIIDEVLYNLRWMLSMQDKKDGGVYHKLTNAVFDGMVMPGVTKDPRYVVKKSTGAALNFAAVMSQSARVFRNWKGTRKLSDTCLAAALQAWYWAIRNPSEFYKQAELNKSFDPDILTGEYGDSSFEDEWFWAASELFVTTSNNEFQQRIKMGVGKAFSIPSWNNTSMLGIYSLLRTKRKSNFINILKKEIKDSVNAMAERLLKDQSSNPWNVVMGSRASDYVWGSSAVAANQGIFLLKAYELSGRRDFLELSLGNADYLLGLNATGYCFVTGAGSKSPMHPHHRPSEADGIAEPVPGFLVGGPNPQRQDGCTYPFKDTDNSYVDDVCSYASNEIAINWNAPAVYLFNGLQSILGRTK